MQIITILLMLTLSVTCSLADQVQGQLDIIIPEEYQWLYVQLSTGGEKPELTEEQWVELEAAMDVKHFKHLRELLGFSTDEPADKRKQFFTDDIFSGSGDSSFTDNNSSGSGDSSFTDDNSSGSGDSSFTDDIFSGSGDSSFTDDSSSGFGDSSFADDNSSESGDRSFTDDSSSGSGDSSFTDDSSSGSGDSSFTDSSSGSRDSSFTDGSSFESGDRSDSGYDSTYSSTTEFTKNYVFISGYGVPFYLFILVPLIVLLVSVGLVLTICLCRRRKRLNKFNYRKFENAGMLSDGEKKA